MPRLGETVSALARHRLPGLVRRGGAQPQRLVERLRFGSNPGGLRMLSYLPPDLEEGAPLVVVLHGCGQTAEDYAAGAGWLALANQFGFAVLCPEQVSANNPNRCFNWFEPDHVTAGSGEAASIRQMVETMIAAHGLDRGRVFVTGLSAGGAMTSALLAAYPDLFAGGAIVAGLPYRAADNMQQAFGAMFQPQSRSAEEWGGLVRGASSHVGPWPRISIWHGDADATVRPGNATEIAKQWAHVHGLSAAPSLSEAVDGHARSVWTDAEGRPMIESYSIAGLGHGVPLASGGPDGYGEPGPYILEAGISSSLRTVEFWELDEPALPGETAATEDQPEPVEPPLIQASVLAPLAQPNAPLPGMRALPLGVVDIEGVINKALASAGLIRR